MPAKQHIIKPGTDQILRPDKKLKYICLHIAFCRKVILEQKRRILSSIFQIGTAVCLMDGRMPSDFRSPDVYKRQIQ